MPGESLRVRRSIILFALGMAVLSVTSPAVFASSVVHGSVYDWSTFDTLNNTEVVVNSIPQQMMVSKDGSYSFKLDKGAYSIVARYGGNGSDALIAMENVTITQDGGDYVIDLILFPTSDFGDLNLFDDNETPIATSEPVDLPTAEPSAPSTSLGIIVLLAIGVLIIVGAAGGYLLVKRRKTPPPTPENPVELPPENVVEPEEPKMPPVAPMASADVTLPDDLREVIRIVEKNGGRITQLDLRKALPYSEAKVSLMITDLESRGIVKKIKKGRGNVIILNRPDNGE